ncbi:MAG: BtrH N-terminal domain-containing protein [Desulfobacterales bacterium]
MTLRTADFEIPFEHRQSSHCESGVASNLFRHYGHSISEAMAFGIGQGLFFGYLPFLRVNKLPLTTFRCPVGGVIRRLTQAFGVELESKKFRNPQKAMAALDARLAQGTPVGCRTGGYWLPYFPEAFRFHFNMHNLIVYGKRGDDYLISDPVFPDPVVCSRSRLMKARFAKGALAPKGFMYCITRFTGREHPAPAIRKAIRGVSRTMLRRGLPLFGVAGMRFLAGRLEKWPENLGHRKTLLHVGQIIRMQEEIGTGGAGFRFMYAAFLQEAAEVLNSPQVSALAEKMTAAGDRWRRFALMGSRNCKGRATEEESLPAMASVLRECADRETEIYRKLLEAIR